MFRELYGLKSSGAAWYSHFNYTLYNIGYKPSIADDNFWINHETKN